MLRSSLPVHLLAPLVGLSVAVVDGGTLSQGAGALGWDARGYYEVALDPGSLTWSP